jgi:class 3 adenylate cyclase
MPSDHIDPLHDTNHLAHEAEIRQIIDTAVKSDSESLRESEIRLRQAIALAKRCGMLSLEAEAQSQLCKVLSITSDHDRHVDSIEQGRALILYRELGDELNQAKSLIALGSLANNTADFVAGVDYLHEAEKICSRLSNSALSRGVFNKLTGLHHSLGNKSEAMLYATQALALLTSEDDPFAWAYTHSLMGYACSLAGQHADAVASLETTLDYCEQIQNPTKKSHFYAHAMADLSEMYLDWGKPDEALLWAEKGAVVAAEADQASLKEKNWNCAGRAALALGNFAWAKEKLSDALVLSRQMGAKAQEASTLFTLSSALAQLGQHKEALEAFRTAHDLEAGFRRDEANKQMEFRRVKKDIDDAKRDMETADRILFTVLPEAIAKRIKGGESRIAEEVPNVSVLFADLVGFTAMSTRVSPKELLSRLELIFSAFDQLTTGMRLEKIKTIGDAYMVVGGALSADADHVERSANLALQMVAAVAQMSANMGVELAIRIGLHSGPAIAGVIGNSRLSYDLWGETINLASRLESNGAPGRIHVSEKVAKCLERSHRIEPRGMMDLKGFGKMPTYFLT